VRFADAGQRVAELSGGNQQKIVIGRWLRRDVRVWLLDEPTRGVDAAARRAIYALLRARAAAGAALLVASSDYEELATLCDRVIVLSNGIIGGELTRTKLTPEAFTAAAFAGFRSHERERVERDPRAHARSYV
jgi:ribose transport system ATP-binding protein